MRLQHGSLVWVPLLTQLTDNWHARKLTDVSILVAKLHLWRAVLHKETVALSALLGGVDVGDHEMCLCIPYNNFKVYTVSNHDQLNDGLS